MNIFYLLLLRAGVLGSMLFYGSVTCLAQINIGQLHILPGTTWVSTTETNVVLDNMDLQYDADPVLFSNTFHFTGTRINSIWGENRPFFYAINVAKVNPGYIVLNQAIDIAKRINFESGLLDLHGVGIFMHPLALLTNENGNSRLIGPTGGYITIDADLNGPEGANPGNLGAILTSTDNLGKVTVSRGQDLQNLNDSGQSIARWYSISPPVGTPYTTKLRFNYLDAESEGFQKDSLVLWQGDLESPWVDIGYTTRDGNMNFVEKDGLTSLSRFTLYPGKSIASITPPPSTPVEGAMLLIGTWINDTATLAWTVTSEYQNDHFDIERKYASQSDFAPIASLPTTAPGGTRSTAATYRFTDTTVNTGPDDISYRIHQVSIGGAFTYSNIVTLKAKSSSAEFIKNLFPTIAVGGRIYIEVGNESLEKMSFMIVDAKGRIALKGELPYESQWLPVHFLGHGVYRLILRSGDQHWHSSFIR